VLTDGVECLVLTATGTLYATCFDGAGLINFLLGPATVALGVPLALNLGHVRRSFHGVGLALLAGSLTSALSGVAVVAAGRQPAPVQAGT